MAEPTKPKQAPTVRPCTCYITSRADSRHNAGVRRIEFCPLHVAAPDMVEALEAIPDPSNEGFCESCGQLDLEKYESKGQIYYRYKHTEKHCWYRQARAILAKVDGKGGMEA